MNGKNAQDHNIIKTRVVPELYFRALQQIHNITAVHTWQFKRCPKLQLPACNRTKHCLPLDSSAWLFGTPQRGIGAERLHCVGDWMGEFAFCRSPSVIIHTARINWPARVRAMRVIMPQTSSGAFIVHDTDKCAQLQTRCRWVNDAQQLQKKMSRGPDKYGLTM